MNFWLLFAINEALAVASAFIGNSSLSPSQKTALQSFIQAGEALVDAL